MYFEPILLTDLTLRTSFFDHALFFLNSFYYYMQTGHFVANILQIF